MGPTNRNVGPQDQASDQQYLLLSGVHKVLEGVGCRKEVNTRGENTMGLGRSSK